MTPPYKYIHCNSGCSGSPLWNIDLCARGICDNTYSGDGRQGLPRRGNVCVEGEGWQIPQTAGAVRLLPNYPTLRQEDLAFIFTYGSLIGCGLPLPPVLEAMMLGEGVWLWVSVSGVVTEASFSECSEGLIWKGAPTTPALIVLCSVSHIHLFLWTENEVSNPLFSTVN